MTNFVENNTGLPYPKTDLVAVPAGADATKYVAATDWNNVCQGLTDAKAVLRGAKWFGLTAQATDPAPTGVSSYIWLKTDGFLYLTSGGTATQIGAGSGSGAVTDGKTITGAGTAGSPLVATRSYLSVKDYGAVGDGATDDAAAITAAITAAISAGLVVWFPKGTYLLNSTVTISVATHLRLTGTEATISYDSTTHDAFWTTTGSSYLHFEHLKWEGSASTTGNTFAGIRVWDNTTDIYVEHCVFEECTPMQCDDSFQTRRLHFTHNVVHNLHNPLHPCSDSSIEDCDFINDTVLDRSLRAQAIYVYGQQNNISIHNCRFVNNSEEDIQIRSSSARYNQRTMFRITDCHFVNSQQYSIWVGSDASIDIGQVIISGNTFLNCSSPIFVEGSRTAIVSSNLVEYNWEYPYALAGSGSGITVVGPSGQAGHLQTSRGALVANNKVLVHHPFVGKISVESIPVDGDTVTVGDITYTWRTAPTVSYDILIGFSTTNCATNLRSTLEATDGLATGPVDVVRYALDVFNDAFGSVYSSGTSNLVVVTSGLTFTMSQTGSGAMTLTQAADYRHALEFGITVQQCITPVVSGNQCDDVPNALNIIRCVQPTVYDNTLSDRSGAASVYQSYGNVFSHYRGNRYLPQNYMNQGLQNHNYCDDWPVVIDDDWVATQQLTNNGTTGRSGTVGIGDQSAYTYLYYGFEVTGSFDSGSLPFRWNDGDAVILFNGVSNTTFNFLRTAPGTNQFNSADSLIALINATSDFTAAYETVQNNFSAPLPKRLIKIKATTTGTAGNSYTLQVRRYKSPSDASTFLTVAQPLLTGVVLRAPASQLALFYGGAATKTKTFVFSPVANASRGVFVQGVDAASQTLAPVVYQSDVFPGVGFYITHSAGTGAEQFFFRVN